MPAFPPRKFALPPSVRSARACVIFPPTAALLFRSSSTPAERERERDRERERERTTEIHSPVHVTGHRGSGRCGGRCHKDIQVVKPLFRCMPYSLAINMGMSHKNELRIGSTPENTRDNRLPSPPPFSTRESAKTPRDASVHQTKYRRGRSLPKLPAPFSGCVPSLV